MNQISQKPEKVTHQVAKFPLAPVFINFFFRFTEFEMCECGESYKQKLNKGYKFLHEECIYYYEVKTV